MKSKKEYAIEIVKQVLTALHEKRFEDIEGIVDESSLNAEDLEECVQGTVELNDFQTIDEYREENVISMDNLDVEENDPFSLHSYITADEGNDLPLVLILKLECQDNGSLKTILEIEPN